MKTYEIGYPCSPSNNISHETIKATEILVTWGGGMGGSSKRYYALSKNGKNEFKLLDGDTIKINQEYIVHEKKVTIIKVVTDITAHSNYHKKTCNKAIKTEYILLNFGEVPAYVDKYTAHDNRIVLSDLDKS